MSTPRQNREDKIIRLTDFDASLSHSNGMEEDFGIKLKPDENITYPKKMLLMKDESLQQKQEPVVVNMNWRLYASMAACLIAALVSFFWFSKPGPQTIAVNATEIQTPAKVEDYHIGNGRKFSNETQESTKKAADNTVAFAGAEVSKSTENKAEVSATSKENRANQQQKSASNKAVNIGKEQKFSEQNEPKQTADQLAAATGKTFKPADENAKIASTENAAVQNVEPESFKSNPLVCNGNDSKYFNADNDTEINKSPISFLRKLKNAVNIQRKTINEKNYLAVNINTELVSYSGKIKTAL